MYKTLAGAGLELLTLAAPIVVTAWLCNLFNRPVTVNLNAVMLIALLGFLVGALTVTLIARLKLERNKTS
jgi:hypothetical protein